MHVPPPGPDRIVHYSSTSLRPSLRGGALVVAVALLPTALMLGAFGGLHAPQPPAVDPGEAVRRQAAIQVPADAICTWKERDAWQPQIIDCDAGGMVSRTIFALDREPVVYRLDTPRETPVGRVERRGGP